MSPLLVDTNAYAAFKRGHSDAVAVLRAAPLLVLSPVIIGELLGGFAAGVKEQQNREDLSAFLSSPRVTVVSVDEGTSERYASIYLALRKAGTPIPTNDMWIAASALQHGLRLFTFDQHFAAVPSLRWGASTLELSQP